MSIVDTLVLQALEAGADELEVERKESHEELFAMKGPTGFGIARIPSGGPEAASLRKELYGLKRRKRRIVAGGSTYELRVHVWESFGEDAFRVEIRPV